MWYFIHRNKTELFDFPYPNKGTDVYGNYDSMTSAATFSIPFANWLSPSTELLFMTGVCLVTNALSFCLFRLFLVYVVWLGTKATWLIATWLSINNNDVEYSFSDRAVVRSSINPKPCVNRFLMLVSSSFLMKLPYALIYLLYFFYEDFSSFLL